MGEVGGVNQEKWQGEGCRGQIPNANSIKFQFNLAMNQMNMQIKHWSPPC